MKVIGVVGQNGSGKDAVLKYIRAKYNIPFLSTGDMVRKLAAERKVEPTRENLGKISEEYFQNYGRGCFVELVAQQIRKEGWFVAGISGIRAPEDVTILRKHFGQSFILIDVYVTDPRTRFNRMVERSEERDPDSYQQFLKQDETEEKMFHINQTSQLADYSINNDGNKDDLSSAIDLLVQGKDLLKP
ncbi:MAG: AAA family ATPase [Chloroflexi bacterium]|nr:AAA family ATPase [Chloroflexota bacterium]